MKEITLIDLTRARNAEHYKFHSDILSIAGTEFATQMNILSFRTEYCRVLELENKKLLPHRDYKETPEVICTDKNRKTRFKYIKKTIAANKINSDESIRTAAMRVDCWFKPYQYIIVKSYAQVTALLTELVQLMQEPDIAADIALLGLTDSFVELNAANEEFHAIYTERSNQIMKRKSQETMKGIRPQTDAAYRAMADIINSMYKTNEVMSMDAEKKRALEAVIDEINATTLQLQQTLMRDGVGTKRKRVYKSSSL